MSVYKRLSGIDCSKHVEKKGKLSYLSWTWAWGILMDHYPESSFVFHPDETISDGTVMVSCTVTVEGKSHTMWLPVMDNFNKSIVSPTTRQISDSRMRCLVKAIALHGLGLYIYAGEDLPEAAIKSEQEKSAEYDELCMNHIDSLNCIRESLISSDYSTAKEAWNELSEEIRIALWKAPTKGGWFTTEERAKMKSPEWSAAQ